MPLCHLCKSKTKLLYNLGRYHYFFCCNCTSLFLDPIPKEKEIETYYRKRFEYSAGLSEEKRIRSRSTKIIQKLLSLHPHGKTLLDIGSGYGYLLEEAKKNNLNITGVELSKNLYVQSFNRLYTNSIYNQTFKEYAIKHKNIKYDFITAIHVIEHIPNPLQFIRQASQLMNRNGILYIETPNFDSWLTKSEKENYTFLTPPDHIWVLSKFSMIRIIEKIKQLNILRISTYSYPEHFMGILRRKLPLQGKQITNNKLQINVKSQILNDKIHFTTEIKKIKYCILDKIIAPLFTPLLNIGAYGSILELYIRKK